MVQIFQEDMAAARQPAEEFLLKLDKRIERETKRIDERYDRMLVYEKELEALIEYWRMEHVK